MSPEKKPRRARGDGRSARFVQISSAASAANVRLFALDENGRVWELQRSAGEGARLWVRQTAERDPEDES